MLHDIMRHIARIIAPLAICAAVGGCGTTIPVQPDRSAFSQMKPEDALSYLTNAASAYDAVPASDDSLLGLKMCTYTAEGVVLRKTNDVVPFSKWYVVASIPSGMLNNNETIYTVVVTSSPDNPIPAHACLAYRRKAKANDTGINAELKNVVTALAFLGVNTTAS